jgi:hypothetical protein
MTMTADKASRLVGGYDWKTPTFFKVWMPYVFERIEHPKRKHAFLPLNRDYAPLGMARGGGLDFPAMLPTHGVYFARDPALIDGVFWTMRAGSLWLYDDSPASRVDYFERLERLMSRQMEMIGS